MKEKFRLATLLFGIALAATVCAAPPSSKRIVAGPVEVTGSGITGSFKVVEDDSGIPSTGTGGACLVFSKHRRDGPTCKADSGCTPGPKCLNGVARPGNMPATPVKTTDDVPPKKVRWVP